MPAFQRSLISLLAGALLLPACAVQSPSQLPGRLSVVAEGGVHEIGRGAETLKLAIGNLRATERRVQAVAADIERLWVRLRLADGTDYVQAIDKAFFSGDQAVATFTGLPSGPVHVKVSGTDAQEQVVGETSGVVTVVSGQTATLDLALHLAPAEPAGPSPTSAPGQVTAEATVVDGPVATTAALPLLGHRTSYLDLGFFNNFVMDPNGDVHVDSHLENSLATYRRSSTRGDTWGAPINPRDEEMLWSSWSDLSKLVCVDAHGRFYTSTDGVTKFASNGLVLKKTKVPGVASGHPRAIAVQDSGEVWTARGKAVVKISEAGAIVGAFDLGSTTSGIVINQSRREVWVALPRASQVVRLAEDGQVLNRLDVGLTGGDTIRDLALDSAGNLWVLSHESGVLTKVGPEGQVLHAIRLARHALGLAVDDFGNAWVVTWREADAPSSYEPRITLYKVSPEGRPLGYLEKWGQPYDHPEKVHIEFDRHGNLFVPMHDSPIGVGLFVGLLIVHTLE